MDVGAVFRGSRGRSEGLCLEGELAAPREREAPSSSTPSAQPGARIFDFIGLVPQVDEASP